VSDQPLPLHQTRRISLTKSQLRTELGAELLSLCQSTTADGRVAPEEAQGLREWLNEAAAAELPAASYLREVVERVLADGVITPQECREVYQAIEAVLPPEVRRQAAAARREVEAAERQASKAVREQESEERRRDVQIAAANFMVAGVRHDGRSEIISRYANSGDPVRLVRDRGNRHSRFAIAVMLANGKQIGFVPEEDAQDLAPFFDKGAKCAAWITKILGSGRVPIPVVQTKLYREDSTIDVDAMSRSYRTVGVENGVDEVRAEPSQESSTQGSAPRGWFWIAVIVAVLFMVILSVVRPWS